MLLTGEPDSHAGQQQKAVSLLPKKYLKSGLFSGTIILTLTGLLGQCIGFYYNILLSRSIGAEEMGIYQLIFPIFFLLLSVSAAGIQTALSRYCAQCKTKEEARCYLHAGLILSVLISLACMILVQKYAAWIGNGLLGEKRSIALLQLMSWSVPFACIHACISGYYFSQKKTAVPSVSQILEQLIRVGTVFLIARIASDTQQALTARTAIWALLLGEIFSCLYTILMICISDKKATPGFTFEKKYYRNLITFSAPITIKEILLSVIRSAENLLIPIQLRAFGYTNTDALRVYGILTGMAFATIMFPSVISRSLSVMLLPEISKNWAAGRYDAVRQTVRQTIEGCMILGLVCTLVFLLTGNRIGTNLYDNSLAGVYIETLSWLCPFIFLNFTLGSILHGLGKVYTALLIDLAGALIRIGFAFVGIPAIGLKAYLWGMLLSHILEAAWTCLCIQKTAKRACS